jgi:arabinofuranosyltransferase
MNRISTLLGWAVALALFASQLWFFRTFFIDDAFITFRYVRQFVAGNGLVYNIGERVEGYSNFLWVMLLALPHAFGAELITTARVLSTALSIGSLLLTYSLARSAPYPVLAPIMLAAASPFGAWTMGGLETSLFAFLVTASVATFVYEEERGRGAASGVLFGLLALARPEGMIFFALAAGFRAWQLFSIGRARLAKIDSRDWLRLAGFIALFVPHFLWRLSYYGYPLPNTVYAKSMGLHPRALIEGVYYLFDGLTTLGGPLLLLLPVGILLLQAKDFRYRFISVCCGTYLLFNVISGGDWMPMHRFWVHILPLLIVLVHAGLMKLAALITPCYAWLVRAGFVFAQIAFLYYGALNAYITGFAYSRALETPLESGTASDSWIAYISHNWKEGDVIAAADAGAIAYVLPLEARIVDMIGLVDGHIAHLKPQFPSGLFGRGDGFGKWDIEYILNQNPRFIEIGALEKRENGEYFVENTGLRLLVNDPRFRARYRQVSDKPELSGLFERIP